MTPPDSSTLRRRALTWMLLPGLVVATAYVYGPRARIVQAVATARASTESARRDMPSVADLARTLRDVETLREQVRAERELTEKTRERVQNAANGLRPSEPEARARAAARTSLVLAERNIALLEESPGFDAQERLPDALVRRLTGSSLPVTPRTVRLRGRYMDVLAALTELVESNVGLIPIELKLTRERDASGVPLWILVVI
ncbi:MAG: hypothetical protein ACKVWV_19010 [Planctomycetota bacterium]